MTPQAARALLGESAPLEDVCAAARWIAPWVDARHSEDVALVALELADQLSPVGQAIWQWWVGCRYPDLVDLESVVADSGLAPGFVSLLEWCLRQGPRGVALYVSLRDAARDFEHALRELERHCRDFAAMASVLGAIRRGTEDLGPTFANLPSRYDYPGLKRGGLELVNRALFERKLAVEAGVPADYPVVGVLPRFKGLSEPERVLVAALLHPLLDGQALESKLSPFDFACDVAASERTDLVVRLRRRGLPVDTAALGGPALWLSQLGEEPADLDASLGEGPRALADFRRVLEGSAGAGTWWSSLREEPTFWTGHWDMAAELADEVLAQHALHGARVELASLASADAPAAVTRFKVRAMERRNDDVVGAWALVTVMDEVVQALQEAEDIFAW